LAVRVQVGLVGDRVEIRVIDQGPGVPEDKRQQIFEPFKAFGRRDDGGGHGLGLAIAKGFTEAMGGELTVEDTPGGGATFVFSMPRAHPTGGKDSHDRGACRR
jgi:two-component system, OmpR family, sensor histidine kinase KdpD